MTADDLSTPLGQQPAKRRRFSITVPHVVVGTLALLLGVFVLWAILGNNPFGGEPIVVVPIERQAATAATAAKTSGAPDLPAAASSSSAVHYDGPPPASASAPPSQGKTVTIIDGKTGARHEVAIPDAGNGNIPRSLPWR